MEVTMTATPTLWKSQTQVNTTDLRYQFDGQITSLQDGGYVVVWLDSYGPSAAIVGQRYDSAGNKVGGEVNLTAPIDGPQYLSEVSVL
jgi:large repetitive protein